MSEHFYLARQVILDSNDTIMGYELLYRDSENSSGIDNPRHATAAVLVNVLNQSGLKNIVGDKLAFINVEGSFLRHDFIESIPSETFVFELTSTGVFDERNIELIQILHRKNYKFSLDLETHKSVSTLKKILPYISWIKIDTSTFEREFLDSFMQEFRSPNLKFIASKVEDEGTFLRYKKAGFDAFQGYYFAKPKIIKDKKLDGNHLTLFKLCNTIQSGASIPEIVQEFEANPSITLQLLQFINSGAFHFRNRISSVHQVITLLGRNTLVQWLMLLLYSKNFGNSHRFQNPLILMVKQRTEIMVNLMKLIKKDASQTEQSEAYFVGILSLMDTLMHIPLKDVVSEFYVDDSIYDALFDQKGLLGELFATAIAVEEFDTNAIDQFRNKYNIDAKVFETMMLEVMETTTQMQKDSNL